MRVLFHPSWRQVGSTRRIRCASYELIHDRARARLAIIAPLRPSLLSAAAWGLAAVARTLFVRIDWDHALLVVLPIVAAINSVLVALPKARQRTTFDLERKRVRIGWRWFAFSEVGIITSSRDSALSAYRPFSLEAQTPEGPRLLMRFDADAGEVEPLAEALSALLEGRQSEGLARLEQAVAVLAPVNSLAPVLNVAGLTIYWLWEILGPILGN